MVVLDFIPMADSRKPKHGEVCLVGVDGVERPFMYQNAQYNAYLREFQNPLFFCDNGICEDVNGTFMRVVAWATLEGK